MRTWKHKHNELLSYYKRSLAATEDMRLLLYYAATGQNQMIAFVKGEYLGSYGTAYGMPDGKCIIVWDHRDTSGRGGDVMTFDSVAEALGFYDTLMSPHNKRMADGLRRWIEARAETVAA